MTYQIEQSVVVKGIGAARIKHIATDGTFSLYFANGACGDRWHASDFERTLSDKEFWAEWRRCKRWR